MTDCDIVFAGVGGQGILLAAEILGAVAVKEGYNVRVSELHGMAQRGGAVVSHIRIGDKALAATVLEGTADVIISLEPMEALRNMKYASQDTVVLVNTTPFTISGTNYPEVRIILQKIRNFTKNLREIDAAVLAEKAGTKLARNIVMLGAAAATDKLPLEAETMKEEIRERVPAKYLDANIKAFDFGFEAVKTPTEGST